MQAIERIDRYTEDLDELAFMQHEMSQDAVMRNAVAHSYFKVDFEIVWKTVQNDLAGLYGQVKQVLDQEFLE